MLDFDQEIKIKNGDAPEFIEMLNRIIGTLVFQYRIDEVCHIRIKNWFDHKWLNYSGYAIVPFEDVDRHSAKEGKWQDKITVPPFIPRRVLSESFFRKRPTNNKIFEKKLHRGKMSNDNLHNRISNYTTNGLFIWYSSDTEKNKRGSFMIYRVQEEDVVTFYASAEIKNGWEITRTKGIEPNELKQFVKVKRS
jgi:hypothetical protein